MQEMWQSNGTQVDPLKLVDAVGVEFSQFRGRNQQDSEELFLALLDILKEDKIERQMRGLYDAFNIDWRYDNWPPKDDPRVAQVSELWPSTKFTTIDALFGGYLLSTITCTTCATSNQTLESFFDLSLPVNTPKIKIKPTNTERAAIQTRSKAELDIKAKVTWSLKSLSAKLNFSKYNKEITIEDCLSNYTESEVLDVTMQCENCSARKGKDTKVMTTKTKQILIALPPPILVLHLKRFQNQLEKIDTTVSINKTLDLSPWVSQISEQVAKRCGQADTTRPPTYHLFGIVSHSGTLKWGHYTAYVRVHKQAVRRKIDKSLLRIRPFLGDVNELVNQINLESLAYNEESKRKRTISPTAAPESNLYDWYHISDSSVQWVSEGNALDAQAYLLLYKRT